MRRGNGDHWTANDAEVARRLNRAGGRLPTEPWGDAPNDIAGWRALRAAILLVSGDSAEARDEADLALDTPGIGIVNRARALSARGMAKVVMSGRSDGIPDLRQALGLVASAKAKNTTLHAGILLNLATAYATVQDRRARWFYVMAALVRAALASRDYEWAREAECIEAFNTLQSRQAGLSADQRIRQYSALARRCVSVGAKRLEGLARTEAASVLRLSDQYTASLFFSERAAAAFEEAGFEALAAGARVAKANVLQSLGLDVMEELGDLLAYKGTRSGLLVQRMAAHSVYAEHLAYLGDYAGAVAHYRNASDVGLALRARGVVAPVSGERLGAALGGLYRARMAGLDISPWIAAFHTLRDDVAGTVWGEHQAAALDLALAMATTDAKQVANLVPALYGATKRTPAAFAAERLDELRELVTSFVRPPSLDADLEEYRDHVRHLVGEQSEEVRVAYRNANLVPVLNRILWTRGDKLTAWAQFRLVEFSRWGSLPPHAVTDEAAARSDAKSVSEAALWAEGRTFPTSMHGDGSGTEVRFSTLDLTVDNFLDVSHRAVEGCAWVGQLYLSGSRLAWAALDVTTGRVLGSRRQLQDTTVRALRSARYWIAPNVGSDEVTFLAANGLGPEYATTLASARVAAGPFVQDHQLARDYLLGLPRHSHAQARAWLKTRAIPDFDVLCQDLGGLFDSLPAQLSTDETPIALSVAGQLRGVPITLAQIAGRPVGCRRAIVTLPPLSVLSYARPTPPGHLDGGTTRWHLTRLGNVGIASGFAPRSDAHQVVKALTASPIRKHAVLYSGHIARGTTAGASSAGIPLGEGANLTAAAVLRAERIQVPERVGIVGCEGAGWNLSDEWGGLAAALLLRGTRDVVASDWTILDTAATPELDDAVADLLVREASLESGVYRLMQRAFEDWSRDHSAPPPQLWASLRVMRR